MGNRKQPFGYKITMGEVVIHKEEANVVQQIFKQYLMGESLQIIADALREQGVIYDDGRSWNKNTIARILEDERYAGEKGYPKLIEQEQLQAVAEKRSQKAASPQKTELQKVLRIIRQMVDTVKVMSKNEIIVTLKGGAEINQRLE